VRTEEPDTPAEAADLLRSAASDGHTVRPRGGGTKLQWGASVPDPDIELSTARLDRMVEHNAGDLTAVVEAGMPLAVAQEVFAASGQMLALDPPLGESGAATIGGIVATGDSGPLRHRYGGPRDLLLGITLALSDGSVVKSGGKVIKNVAGYDLAKLFTGSFGTLGLITQVAIRLHPLPRRRVSAIGSGDDPDALQQAAIELAHNQLELESLDIEWQGASGKVMARCAGAAPDAGAKDAVQLMSKAGLRAEVEQDDERAWNRSGGNNRTDEATVVRVSALPSELARVIRVVMRLKGSLVARAGLGICWVRIPPSDPAGVIGMVEDLRFTLAPFPCVILDAPAAVKDRIDVWGVADGPDVELMRRVKARFDPTGTCNPGVFLGGI
jgi:glycolate oxidase FAD binding subunit